MELDISKPKKLVFNISLANVDKMAIKGKFVIFLSKSMQLVFSGFMENGKIAVDIPVLNNFELNDGKKYNAELWVIANRDYFTIPWTDEIIIKRPINIKTSIKEEKENEIYVLVTKPIVNEVGDKNV